jgi:excisionase family DNA binding protein
MGHRKPPREERTEQLLLTPEEAATVLHVGRTTVYALMKAGELHPVHIGRSCRLSRAELEGYVHRLERPPVEVRGRSRGHERTDGNQQGLFDVDANPGDSGGHWDSRRQRVTDPGHTRRHPRPDEGEDHDRRR